MIKKLIIFAKQKIKYVILSFLKPDTISLHGVTLNIKHHLISQNLRKIFYTGTYEGEEVSILKKHLVESDRIMEIGAGIGFISTFCAQRLGSSKVISYEANPEMVHKIRETYRLNSVNPMIYNAILGEFDEKVDFFLEKNFWSSSTIKRSNEAKKIIVQSKSITDEIELRKPTFLIIDIEGGETNLLPLIEYEDIDKILIEVHPHVIGERAVSECLCLLINNGFNLSLDCTKGNVLFFRKNAPHSFNGS